MCPSGATCLPADCCSVNLHYQNLTKRVGLVQSVITIILSDVYCSQHDIVENSSFSAKHNWKVVILLYRLLYYFHSNHDVKFISVFRLLWIKGITYCYNIRTISGIIGDWMNWFTVAQNEEFWRSIQERDGKCWCGIYFWDAKMMKQINENLQCMFYNKHFEIIYHPILCIWPPQYNCNSVSSLSIRKIKH